MLAKYLVHGHNDVLYLHYFCYTLAVLNLSSGLLVRFFSPPLSKDGGLFKSFWCPWSLVRDASSVRRPSSRVGKHVF